MGPCQRKLEVALGQGALGPRALGPPRATRAPWAPWAPMGAHGGPMGPHGAPWGPLGPLGPKSKLGFDQGALPSANTSPEIRLLGFPSSVSTRGRCLRQTPHQKSDFWDSHSVLVWKSHRACGRAGGAAGGRANSDPTGVHPPTQDCYPPAGRDITAVGTMGPHGSSCYVPARAPATPQLEICHGVLCKFCETFPRNLKLCLEA